MKLYHDNCLNVLPLLSSQSVDAIITDLPYGNNTEYNTYKDTQDNLVRLISLFMPEALRVAKRILITCGVKNIHKYPEPDWILSWATPAGTGSSSWGFCCWQPILAYGKDPYLAAGYGRRPDTIVFTGAGRQCGHPCPKPLDIMKWIVERGTLPGEVILDPFMGSGSTGIVAVQSDRDFIGMEIDDEYFRIAEKEITEAQRQKRLL